MHITYVIGNERKDGLSLNQSLLHCGVMKLADMPPCLGGGGKE